MFFGVEWRLAAEAALLRNLAGTTGDPRRKSRFDDLAREVSRRLPPTAADRCRASSADPKLIDQARGDRD